MHTLIYKDFIVQYKLSKGNVQIADSYKIKDKADMEVIVKDIRSMATQNGFNYKRTNCAWITEWRAHNYMYEHNIAKERTGSVDLNEDESKLKLLGYLFMSWCYKG